MSGSVACYGFLDTLVLRYAVNVKVDRLDCVLYFPELLFWTQALL